MTTIVKLRDAVDLIRERKQFSQSGGNFRGVIMDYAHHNYEVSERPRVRVEDVNLWAETGAMSVRGAVEFGRLPQDNRLALALEMATHRSLYVVYSFSTPIGWTVRNRDAVGFVPDLRYSQITHGHQLILRQAWGLVPERHSEDS